MPVILECECGHHTVRPNHTNSIRRSKCVKCGSDVLHRVKAQKPSKVESTTPRRIRSDKGGKHRTRVKACPAATGCPQIPDCGGCAYAPVMPFAGLGHTVKAPHPMMAMQEGQTVAEAKADHVPRPVKLVPDAPSPAPAVKVDQEQARALIAQGRAHRAPKTPPPAAPARVSTAMLKAAWARVQARKDCA
jgi:hypothetical protein